MNKSWFLTKLVALAAVLGSALMMFPLHAYAQHEEGPGVTDTLVLELTRGGGGLSPWVWVGIGLGVVVVIVGLVLVYSRLKPKKARRRR